MLLEQIVQDDPIAELLKLGQVNHHLLRTLAAIALGDFRRNGPAVGHNPVHHRPRRVAADGAKVVAKRIRGGFARLSHEIGDVNAGSLGLGNRGSDFRDEKIWKDAGVERARAKKNQVGFVNSVDDRWKRRNAARRQKYFLDRCFAGGDARFPVDRAAAGEFRDELDVGKCRRKDASSNRQDFAADANGFGEISCNVCERSEKEIAEIVADEPAAGVKAVLEQAPKQRFIFREGDHAIAYVTWRKNSILAAKTPRAAAVIRDGNNGCEVGYRPMRIGMLVAAADYVLFKPAQKSGQSGASAESYDAESTGERLRFGRFLLHRMT
jgi:hypothetical protein